MSRIQVRRGTSTQWTTSNPVLAQGEPGYETNTGKFKIGNGSTAWNSLGYTGEVVSVAGKVGNVTLDKSDVGLGNVDNTADANKNVLSATKLSTARTINSVNFDGTQNINIPAIQRQIISQTSQVSMASAPYTDYIYLFNNPTGGQLQASASTNSPLSILPFEGSIIDYATSSATWTLYGGAKISSANGKDGYFSLYVDGVSGSRIATTANSTNLLVGSSQFTFEMWVYPLAFGGGLFGNMQGWVGAAAIFARTDSSGTVFFHQEPNGTTMSSSTTLTLNQWSHLAFTRDETTARIFINGVQRASVADTRNYAYDSNLYLGTTFWGGQQAAWNGYIKDFRYTKSVRYTSAGFTPPSEFYTSAVNTMPTALNNNNQYTIKNVGTDTIALAPQSGQTIKGLSKLALATNEQLRLISNGANWIEI